MTQVISEKRLHLTFEISILLKGIHSILEIIGGFLILIPTQSMVVNFINFITKEELTEDPRDFLAHYFIKMASELSFSGQQFVSLYLISHGIIKFIVIWGLYKKKLWAYPASMTVFTFFILYQLYRYTFTHSIWLILFSILDAVVIVLTIHEYKLARLNKNIL